MTPTLAPFADALPVPQRLVAARPGGRLSVPIRAGAHRFHRDLPESAIWGYDGTVPIGTDHGLLRTPARVPPDGLLLASAERADLLVDFLVAE
jgi:hypothetical protein